MNIKTVSIKVNCPKILKRVNSTPTFQRLTRKPLQIGANIERVNHKQYSDMLRLYSLLGIEVKEV